MKVRELIEQLKTLPQELPVVMLPQEGKDYEVTEAQEKCEYAYLPASREPFKDTFSDMDIRDAVILSSYPTHWN